MLTESAFALIASLVTVDEDGWAQYPDEIVDTIGEELDIDPIDAADLLDIALARIHGE